MISPSFGGTQTLYHKPPQLERRNFAKITRGGFATAKVKLADGTSASDSEVRLGPYELHDFFLFHYLANGADADKLAALARIAFKGAYPGETIARTRQTFLRRFRQSQYKRNCVPDGPKITLSLSPRADWRMPSDI